MTGRESALSSSLKGPNPPLSQLDLDVRTLSGVEVRSTVQVKETVTAREEAIKACTRAASWDGGEGDSGNGQDYRCDMVSGLREGVKGSHVLQLQELVHGVPVARTGDRRMAGFESLLEGR